MYKDFKILILLLAAISMTGCYGYWAYMGLHGKSIRAYRDIHEPSITRDSQCLSCHHPDNADEGPPTPHPKFTGCLKCHNDEI